MPQKIYLEHIPPFEYANRVFCFTHLYVITAESTPLERFGLEDKIVNVTVYTIDHQDKTIHLLEKTRKWENSLKAKGELSPFPIEQYLAAYNRKR